MNIKIIDDIKARLPLAGGTMTGDLYDKNASRVFLPVGAVFAFAANSTPVGCLLCNGAAVSRTTYADLFAAIGTTYDEGDGSTTFNLPNLADRFIQGSGTAGSVKAAGLPNATGVINLQDAYFNIGDGVFEIDAYRGNRASSGGTATNVSPVLNMSLSKANGIYGNSITVQPPALTMRYYIKY